MGDSNDNIGGIDGWGGYSFGNDGEHDSWGGGANYSGGMSVGKSFGAPGTGTGGDFGNGPQGSFSDRLSAAWSKNREKLAEVPAALRGTAAYGAAALASLAEALGLKSMSDKAFAEAVANGVTGDGGEYISGDQIKAAMEGIVGSGSKVKSDFGDSTEDTLLGGKTDYKYDMNSSQIWEDYVNSNYDKALGEYRTQADKINNATNKQTGVLDGLIAQLQTGNNLKPITRQVGDQTYSFIPKPNRDTATQISDLMGKRTTGEYASAMGGNANLNYLDKLKDLAEMEQKKIAVDKGIDINQQQVDGSKPGLLDVAKGLGSLFSGVKGLFG